MRIGLAVETDSPGGAETMLLTLAEELLIRGHQVFGLGPSRREGWLTAQLARMGIERDLVHLRGPFGLGAVPQVAAAIRTRNLDVLHSHEFRMAVCGALAARFADCRHLITMHGGTYYDSLLRRRLALRFAAGLSQHTVAVSEAVKRSLADSLLLRPSSIDVVHNGVAVRAGSGENARSEFGLDPGDLLILAVGNLYPVKGHTFLLEAVSRLPRTPARLVLAIAGRGDEEMKLRELAKGLRIEQDVRFLGYRDDVPDLLDAADIFAMPSLSEGLPMAMIEAMLAGKAIVASNVGGVSELLHRSEVGILVPPGDVDALSGALAQLTRDRELRHCLGRAARLRSEDQFTASAMTDKYLDLYED